jgi:hypothetical protein
MTEVAAVTARPKAAAVLELFLQFASSVCFVAPLLAMTAPRDDYRLLRFARNDGDCFASLAMTATCNDSICHVIARPKGSKQSSNAIPRHVSQVGRSRRCDSMEARPSLRRRTARGLLRFARNDGDCFASLAMTQRRLSRATTRKRRIT